MAYDHITVAQLGNIEALRDVTPEVWQHWVDGIPVRYQLESLCLELRKAHPHLKFHANTNHNKTVKSNVGDFSVYSDVSVYVDECDYRLGHIGYGKNYGATTAENPQYMIESRKISNAKYAQWRDQAYRKFCTDPTKAKKIALAYLTPYSASEMATASVDSYESKISAKVYGKFQSAQKHHSELKDMDVMFSELERLLPTGAQFISPQWMENAQLFVDMFKEYKQIKVKPKYACYVSIRMVADRQIAEVLEFFAPTGASKFKRHNEGVKVVSTDDLSEDVRAKIATLMMVDVNQYIDGVGTRVSPRTFWVEVEHHG